MRSRELKTTAMRQKWGNNLRLIVLTSVQELNGEIKHEKQVVFACELEF